jgi:hypothetical protein
MEILALLLLFQIKHWYADFKIQTYMQTVKKGVWLDPIGISHSLDHVGATLTVLVCFSFMHTISAATIVLISFVEGILHYLIDYIKVKYGCKDNTKPLFWNQFGLDQLAHQVTYLAMVYVILL